LLPQVARIASLAVLLATPIAADGEPPRVLGLDWPRPLRPETSLADSLISAVMACEPQPIACSGMRWAVLRRETPEGFEAVAPAKRRRFVRANGEAVGILTADDADAAMTDLENPLVLAVYLGEVDRSAVRVTIEGRVLSASRIAVVGCGVAHYKVQQVLGRWCCSSSKRCWPRREGEPNPAPRKPRTEKRGTATSGDLPDF
jgi:hypothetical protein